MNEMFVKLFTFLSNPTIDNYFSFFHAAIGPLSFLLIIFFLSSILVSFLQNLMSEKK